MPALHVAYIGLQCKYAYTLRLCAVCVCLYLKAYMRVYGDIVYACVSACVCVGGSGLWRLARAAAAVETYFNS